MTALTLADLGPYRTHQTESGEESSKWKHIGTERCLELVVTRLRKFTEAHPEHEPAVRVMLANPTPIPYEPHNVGRYAIEGDYPLPKTPGAQAVPWEGFIYLGFAVQQLGFTLWPLDPPATEAECRALPTGTRIKWALDRVQTDEERRVMVALMQCLRCDVSSVLEVGKAAPVVGGTVTPPGGLKGRAYETARVELIGGPKPRGAVVAALQSALGGDENARKSAHTYLTRLVRDGLLVAHPPGYLSIPGMKRVEAVAASSLDDEL